MSDFGICDFFFCYLPTVSAVDWGASTDGHPRAICEEGLGGHVWVLACLRLGFQPGWQCLQRRELLAGNGVTAWDPSPGCQQFWLWAQGRRL